MSFADLTQQGFGDPVTFAPEDALSRQWFVGLEPAAWLLRVDDVALVPPG